MKEYTKEMLAYTAGLIDGEGCISLNRHRPNSFRFPSVAVTNTTIELLNFLKENFGGDITIRKVYKSSHKQTWYWRILRSHAIPFLKEILPYMKEPKKIARATLIVNDYERLTVKNGMYDEESRKLKQEFEDKFYSFGPADFRLKRK